MKLNCFFCLTSHVSIIKNCVLDLSAYLTESNTSMMKTSQGDRSQTFMCLHGNCLPFCPDLNLIWTFRHILIKIPNTKFHKNPSVGHCPGICKHIDGLDEANSRFLEIFLRTRLKRLRGLVLANSEQVYMLVRFH
jgi:hypothetical protein